MTQDPEIDAMGKLAAALDGLDDDQVARVIGWAAKRFGAPELLTPGVSAAGRGDGAEMAAFDDFAELYDAADPKGEQNKALVSSYWYQAMQGSTELQAQVLNDALKDMGHGIGNITKVMDRLQSKKPALVRQVKKSGKSKQARKSYRLTGAGVKVVEAMLEGGALSNREGELD